MTMRPPLASELLQSPEHHASFVGRAEPLAKLERALERVAAERRAHVVTVAGPLGIGKTRLLTEWIDSVHRGDSEACQVLWGSARGEGPSQTILSRLLRAALGVSLHMPAPDALRAVTQRLSTAFSSESVSDVRGVIAPLVGLDVEPSPLVRLAQKDPTLMGSLQRLVVKQLFEVYTATFSENLHGTLVLVLDDLHRADEESLALVEFLLSSVEGAVLFVCLARPEFLARRDGWLRNGQGRHELLELGPLTDQASMQLMRDWLAPYGDADSPDVRELVDSACALAWGNPALLGHMVHAFRQAGVIVSDPLHVHAVAVASASAGTSENLGLPPHKPWRIRLDHLGEVKMPLSVADAIEARIAALSVAERSLLERAAVLGSVFWTGGLVAMGRIDASLARDWSTLQSAADEARSIRNVLRELKQRDYILVLPDSTFADDDEYAFKHNLEREALLRLLSKEQVRRLHAAAAEWLALKLKDSAQAHDESLVELSRHHELAGQASQAALAWIDAARSARARGAIAKAAEHYGKALGLLDIASIPGAPSRAGAPANSAAAAVADVGASAALNAVHEFGQVLVELSRHEQALEAFGTMVAVAYRLDAKHLGALALRSIADVHSRINQPDAAATYRTWANAMVPPPRNG